MKKIKVRDYNLKRDIQRLAKEFGTIKDKEINEYEGLLFSMEANLLKLHKKDEKLNSRRALEGISIALLKVNSYINDIEYDFDMVSNNENIILSEAIRMSFDPYIDYGIKEIVERKYDLKSLDDRKKYFEDPIKCMLKVKESIERNLVAFGKDGYFYFLDKQMIDLLDIDNTMLFAIKEYKKGGNSYIEGEIKEGYTTSKTIDLVRENSDNKNVKEIISMLPEKMYIISYEIQSKEYTKKKLLENSKIQYLEMDKEDLEMCEEGLEYLILKVGYSELGTFEISDNILKFEAIDIEIIEIVKKIIKEALSFTAKYIGEKTISPEKEMKKEITEDFLNTHQGEEMKSPLEICEGFTTKKEKKEYVESLEIMSVLVKNRGLEILDFDYIRKRVGLKKRVKGIIRDGVEELLIKKMAERFLGEDIVSLIFIWRDFEEKVKGIKGWDKSWAAALENLTNQWYYYGEKCDIEEIAKAYGVATSTVRKKYNEIRTELNIKTYSS
ncbi:MAG: hypothetical protein B6I28_05805 [Fusobacteriia bacterium 4572_132]|nr:MAG: hypothetical protein B6I28_05805 [Fusobacteriia bacterium 4572_132]